MLKVFFVPRFHSCFSHRLISRRSSSSSSPSLSSSLVTTETEKKQITDSIEEYEVVIIGGGSSGLSMSFFLSCLRRKHIVLERGGEVGHFWKSNLWDSFRTATPGWSIQLPAFDIPMSQEEDFLTTKNLLDHFAKFSELMKIPLALNTRVTNVQYESVLVDTKDSTKKFLIETEIENGKKKKFLTRDVVVCTGPYQTPKLPRVSQFLPSHIQYLHSSKYRNPQMVGGVVLVVGSGQSGLEIANELVESGKKVFLSLGNNTSTFPRRYRGYDNMDWLSRMGYFDQDLKSMSQDPDRPSPAELRHLSSSSPYITDQPWFLYHLQNRGCVMLGRLRKESPGQRGGKGGAEGYLVNAEGKVRVLEFDPLGNALEDSENSNRDFRVSVDSFILEENLRSILPDPPFPPKPASPPSPNILSLDLLHSQITTVIFATGYTGIQFPFLKEMVKEKEKSEQYNEFTHEKSPMWYEDGYPATANGQSLAFPGLYFLGLRWLMSAASATMFGAPFDASIIATKIARMRGYPHENMIAPQFLDGAQVRVDREVNWNKATEEDEEHMSASEDEGESERADQAELRRYFPFANPEPVAEAEILASVLPPKSPPLDDNKLPWYVIKEKPKKPRRNLTYAEIQREQKNKLIISQSNPPKTVQELNAQIEQDENEIVKQGGQEMEENGIYSQWQPKLSKRKEKKLLKNKKAIDPYNVDFIQEEKDILAASGKKLSFIAGAHPKHKKVTPGGVFSMQSLDIKKMIEEEDESSNHIRIDFTKKQKKKGVRGTIERYLQGHRGLKDIRKQRKARK